MWVGGIYYLTARVWSGWRTPEDGELERLPRSAHNATLPRSQPWTWSRNRGTTRARTQNLCKTGYRILCIVRLLSYYCLLTLLSEGLEGQCK